MVRFALILLIIIVVVIMPVGRTNSVVDFEAIKMPNKCGEYTPKYVVIVRA